MKSRIFRYLLASSFLAVVLSAALTAAVLRADYTEAREGHIAERCELIAGTYDIYISSENKTALPGDVRIVLLDSGGAVLYDSMPKAGAAETHEIMSGPAGIGALFRNLRVKGIFLYA